MTKTIIRADRLPWNEEIELRFIVRDLERRQQSFGRIELVEFGIAADVSPLTTLSETMAQELMDSLWRCGIRPTEGKGSAGQLAATERHLADLRAIVGKKLDVEMK